MSNTSSFKVTVQFSDGNVISRDERTCSIEEYVGSICRRAIIEKDMYNDAFMKGRQFKWRKKSAHTTDIWLHGVDLVVHFRFPKDPHTGHFEGIIKDGSSWMSFSEATDGWYETVLEHFDKTKTRKTWLFPELKTVPLGPTVDITEGI